MNAAPTTPLTQITGLEVTQDGLRLSVVGSDWNLTRQVSGALIAKGTSATLAAALCAGTMEARRYIPTFNMRLPHARPSGR